MHLIGLAFTSPTVVLPAIDTNLFRVCMGDAQDFVVSASDHVDTRKLVVLVTSLQDLQQIAVHQHIDTAVLFADPALLVGLQNITLLDFETTPTATGWVKLSLTPDQLNQALAMQSDLAFDATAYNVPAFQQSLRTKVTLVGLMTQALSTIESQETVLKLQKLVCEYATGQIPDKAWKVRVAKVMVNAGCPFESVLELERFVFAREAEALWRAFFDHAENQLPIEQAVAKYRLADLADLQWMCSVIPPTVGIKYQVHPKDSPYTG